MLKSLHLKNVGPAPEIAMELGNRLNIITGDNGLGKSFLLDVAWWALTRRWPHEVNSLLSSGYMAQPANPQKQASIRFTVESKSKDVSYESKFIGRDQSWQGKSGRPWNPGLVIYAHAEGSFSVWDPARNYWKTKGSIDVQDRLPAYVFSPNEVWDGLEMEVDGKRNIVCNGLLRDWASWIREDGIEAERMRFMLRELSPTDSEHDQLQPGPITRMSVTDVRDIPSLKTSYSECVPIPYASSGVRRITALAYMLLWCWQEHNWAAKQIGETPAKQVVMLIDEVESHLHPRWQRTILSSLLKLSKTMHKSAKIQLVCATHSPLILASAEPTFEPKTDAWFDLDLDTDRKKPVVNFQKRNFVRRGDISNWLTSEAFDLKVPRSLEAETAMLQAIELAKEESPSVIEIRDVDKALKRSLGETDRFWARWATFKDMQKGARE